MLLVGEALVAVVGAGAAEGGADRGRTFPPLRTRRDVLRTSMTWRKVTMKMEGTTRRSSEETEPS